MFIITGLNPGRDLRLLVVGVNKNGRSEATVLEGFTTKVAQLQVGESVSLLIFLMHLLLTIQFKLMFPIVHTYFPLRYLMPDSKNTIVSTLGLVRSRVGPGSECQYK